MSLHQFFSILRARRLLAGLIMLAMLALAYIRTHAKEWFRRTGPGGTTDSRPPVSLAGNKQSATLVP